MTDNSSLASWQKGGMALLKVRWRAMQKGADVYLPTNPDSRCDMVIDWCGRLYRAQVKYAGGVNSKCRGTAVVSLNKGDHGRRCYTADEIDVLLVYVPVTDQVCWFGPEMFEGKYQLNIRYAPTINNQRKGCIWIEDYVW